MYFNEIIVKNCTYLIRQSAFPTHRCKKHVFSFCGLIVNSGLKVITKNINKNALKIHDFWFSKQKKLCVCSLFKRGKGTNAKH